MAAQRSTMFRGRTAEQDRMEQLLHRVRGGESAVLVVRGESGIGKTALIEDCVGRATGFQVVRIAGIESEMELPFAGLHQLCAPMLAQAATIPDPQQNALRVAFGLTSGNAPDRFLVALATLSLLAEAALKHPLLCVVDDAQWLDAASGQVFGFVARRLVAESVLMLFAIRRAGEDGELPADRQLTGVPELTLQGLADDDARALLEHATTGRLDANVRDRIVAEARGNPLALLELPRSMTAAELSGGFACPDSRDLRGQLEEHFLKRLETLPEATQRLMLVAAADPTGNAALLWRAAQALGIDREAAVPVDGGQLVDIGARVRFRHPLVRSAIYSGASSKERRAAHLALAASVDPRTDPDHRAWHRALAAAGPDEEVAAELEQSAGRAQSRGGLAAAAAFLQRSVSLTQDRQHRVERALTASQAQILAGAFDEALRLLALAEADGETELQRARIDLLRGQIASVVGTGTDASSQLLQAARRLEPVDVNLARETYLDAWAAALFAGRFGGNDQMREVSQAARGAPALSDPTRVSDLLLDGFSLLITEGLETATPTLRKAVCAFPSEELSLEKGLQWGALAAVAAGTLWDFEAMAAVMHRQTELARSAGALAPLVLALTGDVFCLAWRGDLAAATALEAERNAASDAIGIRQAPRGAVLLEALKGDDRHSSRFIQAAIELANAQGQGMAAQVGLWAAAVLSNGLARYEQALSFALRASDAPAHHLVAWALPELIEAAVRTGEEALAVGALERLADSTKQSRSDWGQGISARCRALTIKGKAAEECYREAVDRFTRTALRPEQARTHLLYGEWLRRQNRRTDARHQLRTAYDMFGEIGMEAFSQRALHELRATGETVRKRQEDTRSDLTPQEEHIARLALEGRTNSEIGAQLFISARTVEWHLRKVFMKLDITSRKGLQHALPARLGVVRS